MSEINTGERPGEAGDDLGRWRVFGEALVTYQHAMTTPDDVLELCAPRSCGGAVRLQGAGSGEGIHVRANGTIALDEEVATTLSELEWEQVSEVDWVIHAQQGWEEYTAAELALLLNAGWGIPDPFLLTFDAKGPSATLSHLLGLMRQEEVPMDAAEFIERAESRVADEPIIEPASAQDVRYLVQAVVKSILGYAPTVDDDGDLVAATPGGTVAISVRSGGRYAELWAVPVTAVTSRQAAAREVAVINSRSTWSRWSLGSHQVAQRLRIPTTPFVPAVVRGMVDTFFAELMRTLPDLSTRLQKEN